MTVNENDPKVALTHEQRESLAGTLDVFAEALRERRELRAGDFRDIIAEVRHFQQSPTPNYPSDRSRMVYVQEIRITASTQIAGNDAPTRDDVVKRYPKSVREQFPGRAAYLVRPIPEGKLPAFIFMVALVCYQPTSDTTADLFELVLSWSSDDLDSSLPELIEREIRDIEWDWMARSRDGEHQQTSHETRLLLLQMPQTRRDPHRRERQPGKRMDMALPP
jgi:hypothetical protein